METGSWITFLTLYLLLATIVVHADTPNRSHPPLRPLPQPSSRPMEKGPAFFCDAEKGNDENKGAESTPWRTIAHALTQLSAGDTLYLRGGTYFERVYCAVAGTAEKRITIRSYPGELAILDGSFPEFQKTPESCWEPYPAGGEGAYRSVRSYKNLRNLHGSFGDSMIGLQIYYYGEDLKGERYVGPGLWYDATDGRIHTRLQHYTPSAKPGSHAGSPLQSYKGETDPRKLPLIIAGFQSVPLTADQARYLTIQDLVIRGGGYEAVLLQHAHNLILDNVTIYAGTYGLKARNTGPFKMVNSAICGSIPPWSLRGETSLKERPWVKKGRDLTRLNTHALLVPFTSYEFCVYFFPYNHDWEISNCEFTDGHDGIYLGDIDGLKFHHNLVENCQDDGVYLTSFAKIWYPQFPPPMIYQNVIRDCLMVFAFGGQALPGNGFHVFRNILNGRAVVSDHGSPVWEPMRWYHNTILTKTDYLYNLRPIPAGKEWQAFNNLALTGPTAFPKEQEGAASGGNVTVADPKFSAPDKYSLKPDSLAVNAGVPIPENWFDPLREKDADKPDAGAIPLGAGPLKVGRFGRHEF